MLGIHFHSYVCPVYILESITKAEGELLKNATCLRELMHVLLTYNQIRNDNSINVQQMTIKVSQLEESVQLVQIQCGGEKENPKSIHICFLHFKLYQ